MEHRDAKNLPFGWCMITALGEFDPTKGGYFVLSDLKIFIEFPPGSTILIPSATLRHCNIPVQSSETRTSFTQFAAGDLFRYVQCGFMTEKELAGVDPEKYAEMLEKKKSRWARGVELFSTESELLLDNILDIENLL